MSKPDSNPGTPAVESSVIVPTHDIEQRNIIGIIDNVLEGLHRKGIIGPSRLRHYAEIRNSTGEVITEAYVAVPDVPNPQTVDREGAYFIAGCRLLTELNLYRVFSALTTIPIRKSGMGLTDSVILGGKMPVDRSSIVPEGLAKLGITDDKVTEFLSKTGDTINRRFNIKLYKSQIFALHAYAHSIGINQEQLKEFLKKIDQAHDFDPNCRNYEGYVKYLMHENSSVLINLFNEFSRFGILDVDLFAILDVCLQGK